MLGKIVTVLSLACTLLSATAQETQLLWQRTIGGAGEDQITSLEKDSEGNIYVLGSIQSSVSQTSFDISITKLSDKGQFIWSKVIGAEGDDNGISLLVDSHDELVVLASSTSQNGAFGLNLGFEDVHVFRISKDGDLLNHHHFGGSQHDIPRDVIETAAGEYLICGNSRSSDMTFSQKNYGQWDAWLLSMNYDGNINWVKNYGGTDEDYAMRVMESDDGKLFFLGHSTSYDGDIADNYGDFDIILYKLESDGTIIWQKQYGGLEQDLGVDMTYHSNGNVLITANTLSNSVHVGINNGFSDAWLVEVDSKSGTIIEETSYGDQGSEYATSIMASEEEILLVGTTNSDAIKGSFDPGEQAIWIAHYSPELEFRYHTIINNDGFDRAAAFCSTPTGMILAGSTNSSGGFVQGQQGKNDGWIFKIREANDEGSEPELLLHPNPTTGPVYLNGLKPTDQIEIYNHSGQLVVSQFRPDGDVHILDLAALPKGLYHVRVLRKTGTVFLKVVRS